MIKVPQLQLINRDIWLVKVCRGKRILHLGCTNWPMTELRFKEDRLLHKKICAVGKEVIGIDIERQGIERLEKLMPGERFILHNAENIHECKPLIGLDFDIILAADILEHLSNPGLFLESVQSILTSQASLIITTPHAFGIKRFLALLFLAIEWVNPDHVTYFSVSTLSRLLSRYALEVEQVYGLQWRNPSIRNRLSNTMLLPALWLSRGRLCDEIALVARKSSIPLSRQ